jgi:hypothetical protein
MRLFLPLAVVAALLLGVVQPAQAWENYEQGENVPVVTVPAAPASHDRLPIFGLMADVGVPDGLIGSLTIRPWSWIRLAGGGGSNGISRGWRGGLTLLPFGAGPTASVEYGRYQDGDANPLAKKFIGSSFDGNPLLERVGYEYFNAHVGLDFGSRRVVFFVHAGLTMMRGKIHNVDAAIRNTTSSSGTGMGTTEVTVPQDPTVKAKGTSIKLGLIVYIW